MTSSAQLGPQPGLQQFYEMYQAFVNAPKYHLLFEAFLALWIIKLLFVRSYRLKLTKPKDGSGGGLTEKEKDELIREWVPEPLVPARSSSNLEPTPPASEWYIERLDRQFIVLGRSTGDRRVRLLDLATYNFLGLAGRPEVAAAARVCLRKYGVGACGPRGFYGTIDVHLQLEQALASYLGTEEACIYSYGLATISSLIPAFSKRGDIVFCDEAANFGIQKGLQASRSVVKFFRHNDVAHLDQLLQLQAAAELRDPAKARVTKKFIVVEGIYQYTGELCPLPQIVEFRKKYKARIFVEESLSFGVLGPTGRGITEHFGIPITDVDLVIGSMEYSLGSMGGFCAGKKYIIENNYLSGLGYCFSASLPPIQATAALTALEYMGAHLEVLRNLRSNTSLFRSLLADGLDGKKFTISAEEIRFKIIGNSCSPLAYVTAYGSFSQKSAVAEEIRVKLIQAAGLLQDKHEIFIRAPEYLYKEEMNSTRLNLASLKICIKTDLDVDQLKSSSRAICAAIEKVFGEDDPPAQNSLNF